MDKKKLTKLEDLTFDTKNINGYGNYSVSVDGRIYSRVTNKLLKPLNHTQRNGTELTLEQIEQYLAQIK